MKWSLYASVLGCGKKMLASNRPTASASRCSEVQAKAQRLSHTSWRMARATVWNTCSGSGTVNTTVTTV